MGRFTLRRNRQDHTTDEEIEYYQPETGQTLQRTSLNHAGESGSEAEGLHGGGDGLDAGSGSKSMAEKFRRSSVDLGRRIVGKLRLQSLSRVSSGLGVDADGNLGTHGSAPLHPELPREGGGGGSGAVRDVEDPSRGQRHSPATASRASMTPAAAGTRGTVGGRRASLGGMIAAAAAAGGAAAAAGSGGLAAADSTGYGGSMLRSFANLFTRTSTSGDAGMAAGGGGGGAVGGRSSRRFRRRSAGSSGYGSTSGSVSPSPEGTTTGMSNAHSVSSELVIVQPTKMLVPLEIRQRLLQDAAAAAAASAAAGMAAATGDSPGRGGSGSGRAGGGGGGSGGARMLNSGHLRNASLRHYLHDGVGEGSIATAAAAAAAMVAASVSGSIGGDGDGRLPPELAGMYASTSSYRSPGAATRRRPVGGDPGVDSPSRSTEHDTQQKQRPRSRPQSRAQLQLPPSPLSTEGRDDGAGASFQRRQQSRASWRGGSGGGAGGSVAESDGAAADDRTSAGDLVAQLQQQIAQLRQLKDARSAGGAVASAAGSSEHPNSHQQHQPQHEHQQQQQQPSQAINNSSSGVGSGALPTASAPLRNLRPQSQGSVALPRPSPSQQGYVQQQQQQLSGSQNGSQFPYSPQQQSHSQQQQQYSQRLPSQASVRSLHRSSGTDGSSSEIPMAVALNTGMIAIYEDSVHVTSAASGGGGGGASGMMTAAAGSGGAASVGAHPISFSPETSTRTSPNGSTLASPGTRLARGTSRMRLPSAMAAAFGFRSGTGSGESAEGGGGAGAADGGGGDLCSASRGGSFSLVRTSPLGPMGHSFLGPGSASGSATGTLTPDSAGGGGGLLARSSTRGFGAKAKSSKAILGSRASAATGTAAGAAAATAGVATAREPVLRNVSGSANSLTVPVRNDQEVQARRPWDGSSPAAAAAGELQRNPAAGRSATVRKLRRTVELIRIAMLLKNSSADDIKKAVWEGSSSSSPQLQQEAAGGMTGSDSVRSELSNMDLSPKIKRGRLRRASVDGFLRDFMTRSFAVQQQKQQHPRRRSLDRDSAGKMQMANRFFDDDSDEEDTVGQSQPTPEPPYEIRLPVPPPPRASFEYQAEHAQDASTLPWSAQSSRAPSIDESATSHNPSDQITSYPLANRQPPTDGRGSDSASSSRSAFGPRAAAAAAAAAGGSGGGLQSSVSSNGAKNDINGLSPQSSLLPQEPPPKAATAAVAAVRAAAPPQPKPHQHQVLPPPPPAAAALPPQPLTAQTTAHKPVLTVQPYGHQPSRFAPKGPGDSSRSISPAGGTTTPPPSPWGPSPTAAPAVGPVAVAPAAAAPAAPPPRFLGSTSLAAASSDGDSEDGGGGGGRRRSPGAGMATSPNSRSSVDVRRAGPTPQQRRFNKSSLLATGDQGYSLELSSANPIASDLELEDLIQAISRSSSTLPGATGDGSRRGTGTGTGSGSLNRQAAPISGGTSGGVGSGGGGGGIQQRLTSGSNSSGGDGSGPTMQIFVRRRSGESLSPGVQQRLELSVELQGTAEVCPLEPVPTKSLSLSQPQPQTQSQQQQQQPETQQLQPSLPQEPTPSRQQQLAQQQQQSQAGPGRSGSCEEGGPERGGAAPVASTEGRLAVSAFRDLDPIKEQPNAESSHVAASGALASGGGAGGGRNGDVPAYPVLQRMQNAWELPEVVPTNLVMPPPPPGNTPAPTATAPPPQARTQGGGGAGGGAASAPGGAARGGVSKTVQVLLQKLNALPPTLRADIIKQLVGPVEVRSLLRAGSGSGGNVTATVAAAAGSGGSGGETTAAAPAAPAPAPPAAAAPLLPIHSRDRNPLPLNLLPEINAAAAAAYGASHSHPPAASRAAVLPPAPAAAAATAPAAVTAAYGTHGPVATAVATITAAPATAGAAGSSPPRKMATSSLSEIEGELRGRVSRKVMQPSEAFISGKVDWTEALSAATGATAAESSTLIDPRVAAALQAAGLQVDGPAPTAGAPARAPDASVSGGDRRVRQATPMRYRPSGKNTYQPTSAEVLLAKSIGALGPAAPSAVNGVVEGSWLLPIHEAAAAPALPLPPPVAAAAAGGMLAAAVPPSISQFRTAAASGGGGQTGSCSDNGTGHAFTVHGNGPRASGAFATSQSTTTTGARGSESNGGFRSSAFGSSGAGVSAGGMDALLERLVEEVLRQSSSHIPDPGSSEPPPSLPSAADGAAAAAAAAVGRAHGDMTTTMTIAATGISNSATANATRAAAAGAAAAAASVATRHTSGGGGGGVLQPAPTAVAAAGAQPAPLQAPAATADGLQQLQQLMQLQLQLQQLKAEMVAEMSGGGAGGVRVGVSSGGSGVPPSTASASSPRLPLPPTRPPYRLAGSYPRDGLLAHNSDGGAVSASGTESAWRGGRSDGGGQPAFRPQPWPVDLPQLQESEGWQHQEQQLLAQPPHAQAQQIIPQPAPEVQQQQQELQQQREIEEDNGGTDKPPADAGRVAGAGAGADTSPFATAAAATVAVAVEPSDSRRSTAHGQSPPPRSSSPARFLSSLLRSIRSPRATAMPASRSRSASAGGVALAAAAAAVSGTAAGRVGGSGGGAALRSAAATLTTGLSSDPILRSASGAAAPPPPPPSADVLSSREAGGPPPIASGSQLETMKPPSTGNSLALAPAEAAVGTGAVDAARSAEVRDYRPPDLMPLRLHPATKPAAVEASAAANLRPDEVGSSAAAEEIAAQLKQLQRLQWQLLDLQRLQLHLEQQQQAQEEHQHQQRQQQQQQQAQAQAPMGVQELAAQWEQQEQMRTLLAQLRQQQDALRLRHGQLRDHHQQQLQQQQQQLHQQRHPHVQQDELERAGLQGPPEDDAAPPPPGREASATARAAGEASVLDVPTPNLTSWQPLPLPRPPTPPRPSPRAAPLASPKLQSAVVPLSLRHSVKDIIPPGYTVVSNELYSPSVKGSGGGAATPVAFDAAAAAAALRAADPAVVLLPSDCIPIDAVGSDGVVRPGLKGIHDRGGGRACCGWPPPPPLQLPSQLAGATMAPDGVHLVLPAMVLVDARSLSPERLSPSWIAQPQQQRGGSGGGSGGGPGDGGITAVAAAAAPAAAAPLPTAARRRGGGGGGRSGEDPGADRRGSRRVVSKVLLASHPLQFD